MRTLNPAWRPSLINLSLKRQKRDVAGRLHRSKKHAQKRVQVNFPSEVGKVRADKSPSMKIQIKEGYSQVKVKARRYSAEQSEFFERFRECIGRYGLT